MLNRPNIPMEIKRRILMEAGYRCAIPTCRFPLAENAHIFSWSESKDHSYENLIALCPNCHTLFDSGKIDRLAIIAYKKKLMFLNDVYSRFELDVLDYLKNHKRALIPGILLIKRLIDEGIVTQEEKIMIQSFGDGEDILGILTVVLTDKGKSLLDDWAQVDKSLTYDNMNG
ncbi:MAG: HNH endonuclease [Desulfobacterales bacterium]|nr:HNH endonuclease [Desulfobacterales bacterium]